MLKMIAPKMTIPMLSVPKMTAPVTTAVRRYAALVLILAAAALLPPPAAAEIRIDITRGVVEPVPIAITNLYSGDTDAAATGQDISSVIAANLERSGLFRPVNPAAFIQSAQSLQTGPNYADWRVINADLLVGGRVERESDGRFRVEFRLWDVVAGNQIEGLAYYTAPDNWRRVAHIISDAIYQRITGEVGYFDTRIVYVSETGPGNARIKRLAIMDQDGENHRYLTDGNTLVLTPRFSPTAQEITYMAYFNNQPRVYLLNIDTGRQELLGDFPGMTFAPRFSPDGNQVVMSLARSGVTNIHLMDLRTRTSRQLTDHPSINTSPSFSPDGSRIAFESDRGGRQQIYIMNADGSDVQRISFGDGSYGGPVWSPRGDLIAFTKIHQGRFHIGVMRPDGSGERLLADAYHVEGPTWAPNGRVLMYFSETPTGQGGISRQSRLRAVDLSGQRNWAVPTPLDGSDPAWSPLLP